MKEHINKSLNGFTKKEIKNLNFYMNLLVFLAGEHKHSIYQASIKDLVAALNSRTEAIYKEEDDAS